MTLEEFTKAIKETAHTNAAKRQESSVIEKIVAEMSERYNKHLVPAGKGSTSDMGAVLELVYMLEFIKALPN